MICAAECWCFCCVCKRKKWRFSSISRRNLILHVTQKKFPMRKMLGRKLFTRDWFVLGSNGGSLLEVKLPLHMRNQSRKHPGSYIKAGISCYVLSRGGCRSASPMHTFLLLHKTSIDCRFIVSKICTSFFTKFFLSKQSHWKSLNLASTLSVQMLVLSLATDIR